LPRFNKCSYMASLTEALGKWDGTQVLGPKPVKAPAQAFRWVSVLRRRAQPTLPAEGGFILIEILVSALVLVIASAGVVTLLQTTIKAQGEQRHGSEAYALAQEDQARLASMRLGSLKHLDETRPIMLNKAEFKVHSLGVFLNDKTSTVSCAVGSSSADYVQLTSIVTWPGMKNSEKAKIVSILSQSNGSLDPNNGTLAVSVTNEPLEPMANVRVYGTSTGGGAFDGYTDAAGCASFPDLPAVPIPNYTMTADATAAGLVNKDGKSTEQKTVGVKAGEAENVALQFDRPGTIPLNFKYRVGSTGTFATATADSVVAYNGLMTTAKVVGTPGGTREATVNATPLFPFTSAYTLYPGSCASNNPNSEGKNPAGVATVVAPRGATAAPATIQLPALDLTVKKSSTVVKGAKVTITDNACKVAGGSYVKRTFTTNEAGKPSSSETGLAEPALPWGQYTICASAIFSPTDKRKKETSATVQNLAEAKVVSIDLNSGYTSGSTC
jgi:type II secretory pathway pseudopilin PulG